MGRGDSAGQQMSVADEPRFVLLDIGASDVYASIADPDKWPMEAEYAAECRRLQAAARTLSAEDVKWIAENIEEHGGAGILYDYIEMMMPEPDENLRAFCRSSAAHGQGILLSDGKAIVDHLNSYGDEDRLSDEQLAEIATRAADSSLAREPRFPVYLLTRAQLLELFDGFGRQAADWSDASDEELYRACAIMNAGIHTGDDTGEDIYDTFLARIGEGR